MNAQTEQLERTRSRIQSGGRILTKVCQIISIVLIVQIVVQAAILVAVYIDQELIKNVREIYDDNALYRLLEDRVDLSGLPDAARAAIGCFVGMLTYGVLLMLTRMAVRMTRPLAQGGRPFDVQTARSLRRLSWAMLLLCFYNVLLGLIAFGMIILFSYIMEYGGYIQAEADETNRIQEEMILSFAEITENKSGQTGQHIKRVSEYARILAETLELPPAQCESIRIASTMHDVGKLLIPSEILEKPGRLTDEEYAVIKRHTTYGGQLLENVEGDEMALSRSIALQHHERFDGNGYPARLTGEDISLEGRIVAVADVYDALTSRRSYKEAWDEEKACQEILAGRGTQFDPQVVDAFEKAHDRILEVRRQFADA